MRWWCWGWCAGHHAKYLTNRESLAKVTWPGISHFQEKMMTKKNKGDKMVFTFKFEGGPKGGQIVKMEAGHLDKNQPAPGATGVYKVDPSRSHTSPIVCVWHPHKKA